jgi:hypothetical protein
VTILIVVAVKSSSLSNSSKAASWIAIFVFSPRSPQRHVSLTLGDFEGSVGKFTHIIGIVVRAGHVAPVADANRVGEGRDLDAVRTAAGSDDGAARTTMMAPGQQEEGGRAVHSVRGHGIVGLASGRNRLGPTKKIGKMVIKMVTNF